MGGLRDFQTEEVYGVGEIRNAGFSEVIHYVAHTAFFKGQSERSVKQTS